MLLIEKIVFLKKVSLFARIDSEELMAIVQIAQEESYAKDTLLFKESDFGDKFYVIVSGVVELIKKEGEQDKKIAELSSGEYFGEMAILTEDGRSLTAVVSEPVLLLTINRDDFKSIIDEIPSLSFQIFKVLSDRIKSLL
ncbi:MAG: cyclic nucleotide-binding domain-containing protein [Candidatus Ancaeobacter aquaticus]|nr:cyclic nucleotide-binding domain-containing protein [Candidatus Ancaeobacter aquaticus]